MISCIIINWGVTVILSVLLFFSEYLGRSSKFKDSSVIDFTIRVLKVMLNRKYK